MLEYIVKTVADLPAAAEKLLEVAGARKKVILLGDLGAGKTSLIQHFCQLLAVKEQVVSPTFSLINEYSYWDKTEQKEKYIYHLDLYRLHTMQEAIDIGIEDYLYDDNYCLIEWPQIIRPILPEDVLEINIELMEDSSRKIIFL